MRELRILTLHLDPRTGLFDDGPLRGYLRDREVLASHPHFFVYDGRPTWSIALETRLLQDVATESGPEQPRSPPNASSAVAAALKAARPDAKSNAAERAAFQRLLTELDESERARYDHLTAWRRDAARREGVPHYVIATNTQLLDLTRRNPATLTAIAETHGIGQRRVAQHGQEILEVLHGAQPQRGSERPEALRSLDGADPAPAGPDGEVPEALSPHADGAHRPIGAADS